MRVEESSRTYVFPWCVCEPNLGERPGPWVCGGLGVTSCSLSQQETCSHSGLAQMNDVANLVLGFPFRGFAFRWHGQLCV